MGEAVVSPLPMEDDARNVFLKTWGNPVTGRDISGVPAVFVIEAIRGALVRVALRHHSTDQAEEWGKECGDCGRETA